MSDLESAKALLVQGSYTCVLCREEEILTATKRGIAPLLDWVNEGKDLSGFSAADRVVGRGAAFLYCLLGVKEVYARIMSRPAAQVLTEHGIQADAGEYVSGIINRAGDGPCPFEAAVMDIHCLEEALTAIRTLMAKMRGGN